MLLTVALLAAPLSACNMGNHHNEPTDSKTDHTSNDLLSNTPAPASDFEYTVNSNQTGILISKYLGSSEHVVIPSHIDNLPVLYITGVPDEHVQSAIEEGAFEGSRIQTIVIPSTVKGIGYKCFKDCQNLTTVTIASDSALTQINASSFENCSKLEKIDLSSTQVKEIGASAFGGCKNLKTISFSSTLEKIEGKAFYECSSLLEVNLPESLTEIGVVHLHIAHP